MNESSPPETTPTTNDTPADLAAESWPVGDQKVSYQETLFHRSFLCLLAVQFLTVLNDQAFRWLVVPLAKGKLGEGNDAAALSLGLFGFMLPYLLLTTPAGFLADRFSKASVITACKLFEILVLGLGCAALWANHTPFLFVVVGLTGCLAALFAPAKMGCIPELVQDSQLSNANGWMGLMNVVPCAAGFLLGNFLSTLVRPAGSDQLSTVGLMCAVATLLGTALAGWLFSLGIRRVPAGDAQRKLNWNFLGDTVDGLRFLGREPALFRTASGIAFFWMLASLSQLNIDQFVNKDLHLTQHDVGWFGAVLVVGVGIGSVMAGRFSDGRVELGLVPVGALGVVITSWLLFVSGQLTPSAPGTGFYLALASLTFLGISAGLFDVPLEAYLQHRADPKTLGMTLAAVNFLVCVGSMVVALLFWLLLSVLKFSPTLVFFGLGLATLPVLVYSVLIIPGATIRLLFWLFSHTAYRVRVFGRQHVPLKGGVLLVANHVTFIDGILLMATAPRPIRFIAYADFVNHPRLNWLAKIYEVIPIRATDGPKSLIQSLKTAREALLNGSCVCIFAEGALTRTGQMQPFQGGFLKILQGTNAPVVPVYLHGLWGSIFSYRGGKFFWKKPRRWPYPVSVMFGEPMKPNSPEEVSRAVQLLASTAVELDKQRELTPPRQFLRACRQTLRSPKIADSSGVELTGGKLLAGALAFRSVLRRQVLKRDEPMVGIFLPPSVGCALANLAVTLNRRVTVNLNYTMSDADLAVCSREAKLQHIITSRKMLEKRPIQTDVPLVFLEDLKEQITPGERRMAGLAAYVLPAWITERIYGLTQDRADDPITTIFTSGSTGEPKGVLLSHHNISATVSGADQLFQIEPTDVVLGVVPIFHSLGYVATLWLPLCFRPKVVYHPNPLDARQIGELAQQHGASILFGTPTFLRGYLKRIDKPQFSRMDLAVVGAEKLTEDLARQCEEKYGFLPSEGYGATETSGPAAVNVPDHRSDMVHQKGTKLGTVGRPMPGVTIAVVDPETRNPLPKNTEGLVLIKGPNVMLGYLNRPEKTAAVIQDGWYNTGDMGLLDDEGFLHITGRMSRFSKIGGEMVPHIKVEELLLTIVADPTSEDASIPLVVTAVPDAKKGERLIVLHRQLPKPVPQIIQELSAAGLPNLWVPGQDGFVLVDQIPVLGTGKIDLRGVKQLALDRSASGA